MLFVWVALGVLAGLLAVLLLLLVALLLVPVELAAVWREARREFAVAGPGVRLRADIVDRSLEVRLFGRRLLRRQLQGGGARRGRKKTPRRRASTRVSPRRLWAERRVLLSALARFLRRVHIRRLSVDLTVASDDPAVTGAAIGMAHALLGALPARVRAGVRVAPDFLGTTPRLAGDVAVRLRPLQVALLGMRSWWALRRARVPRGRRENRRMFTPRTAGGRV